MHRKIIERRCKIRQISLLILFFIICEGSISLAGDLPNPLFIFDWSQKWWVKLPPEIRENSVMEINSFREDVIKNSKEKNIPVIVRLISWGFPEQYRHIPNMSEVKSLFERYPNVIGVSVTEQGVPIFTKAKRDYISDALDVCAQHNKYLFWVDSQGSSKVWINTVNNRRFLNSLMKHNKYIIPILEMNTSKFIYESHSVLLGLWLNGIMEKWGFNPQTWYWEEAGFKNEYDKSYGTRKGDRKYFPPQLYGQMILLGASSGATVFFIGGEKPPHAYQKDGSPSSFWNNSIYPVLKFIKENRMTSALPEVKEKVKLGVYYRQDVMFYWDNRVAHTGEHSLSIANNISKSYCEYAEFINVQGLNKLNVSVWAKMDGGEGAAFPSLLWYNFNSRGGTWPFVRATNGPRVVKKDREWQNITFESLVPKEATHVLFAFLTKSLRRSRVWFDDYRVFVGGSGDNLVKNSGMEVDTEGRRMPDGWECGYSAAEPLSVSDYFGFGSMFRETYGMQNPHDFIPHTARYFIIPIFPTEGKYKFSVLNVSENHENYRKIFNQYYPQIVSQGFIVSYGDRLFATNTFPNSDKSEKVAGKVSQFTISTDLGVHTYIFAKEVDGKIRVLVDGPRGRTSTLKIESPEPFHISGESKEPTVRYAVSWNPEHTYLDIKIDHKVPTAFTFTLERGAGK